MTTALLAVKRAVLLLIASLLFLGVTPNESPEHSVTDEQACKMCITVLSDCHLETNNPGRFKAFATILQDAANVKGGNDVALFLGDNTMNGQITEAPFFYGTILKTKLADQTIIVCGNHDIGNGKGIYNILYSRFRQFSEAVTGSVNQSPYYAVEVKGITFVVLCPEDLCVHEFPISDAQYEFLENTLKKCTAHGKPTFVLCHHPTYDIDTDYGARLKSILSSYPNVFYISGHTHASVRNGWTFKTANGFNEINLPRCTELDDTDTQVADWTGYGIQLEVYDASVLGRVRNYYYGEWADISYSFSLQ